MQLNILILQSFVKDFEHRKDELNFRFDLFVKDFEHRKDELNFRFDLLKAYRKMVS